MGKTVHGVWAGDGAQPLMRTHQAVLTVVVRFWRLLLASLREDGSSSILFEF